LLHTTHSCSPQIELLILEIVISEIVVSSLGSLEQKLVVISASGQLEGTTNSYSELQRSFIYLIAGKALDDVHGTMIL